MKINIFNTPIFKYSSLNDELITGFKIKLLNLFSFAATLGESRGDHLHFTFGIYKFEIFIGASIWR